MTLNMITTIAESAGITLSIDGDGIAVDGPKDRIGEVIPMIKEWKPELIHVFEEITVDDVGCCNCGSSLLGFPTHDGYVNRVCPACGRWHTCFQITENVDVDTTPSNLSKNDSCVDVDTVKAKQNHNTNSLKENDHDREEES